MSLPFGSHHNAARAANNTTSAGVSNGNVERPQMAPSRLLLLHKSLRYQSMRIGFLDGKADSKTAETLTAFPSAIKSIPLNIIAGTKGSEASPKTTASRCAGLYNLVYDESGGWFLSSQCDCPCKPWSHRPF